MPIFHQKPQRTDFLPQQAQSQHTPGFWEEVSAAYKATAALGTSLSEEALVADQWSPIVDVINQRMPSETPVKNPVFTYQPSGLGAETVDQETLYYMNVQKTLNTIFDNPELFPEYQDLTHEQIMEQAKKAALDAQAEYEDIQSRTSGTQSFFAGLVGGGGAIATDPVVAVPAVVTGLATAGLNLLRVMFAEAVVSAGSEALVQKEVSEWYESLGLEYTPEQFWTAVTTAGVTGGALPPAIVIGGKTIRLTAEQTKRGYEALKNSGAFKGNKNTNAAEMAAESIDDAVASSPVEDVGEHLSRLQEAEANIANMDGTPFRGPPASRAVRPTSIYESDESSGIIQSFNPNELEADPSLFRLEGEQTPGDAFAPEAEFDPVKSGQVVVYEYADGRRVILDGEKRVALAKQSGVDKVYGQVIREVDGVTPEMAKVIRETIVGSKDSFIRQQANALTNLSDDGFLAMARGEISADFAAIVGDLIPDNKELQDVAIAAISKASPENALQAEAIVRQVSTGETTKQVNLFDSNIVQEALYAERAKVLDMAIKSLKNDKKSFQALLESTGDDLAKTYSKARAKADAKAITYVQTLANQRGELFNALNDAARAAKQSGNYRTPARGFTDAVRRGIESGDFNRIEAGNVRQSIYAQAQKYPAKNVAEVELRQFSNPADSAKITDQIEEDLFGETAVTPELLDRPIPIEDIDPATGQSISTVQTVRQMTEEFEQDAAIMSRLGECVR